MNQKAIDYKRLGEVTGKAWRLSDPGASYDKQLNHIEAAIVRMGVPKSSRETFRRGFKSGVAAVDRERGKAKK